MRWNPEGYKALLQKELPDDAFYDPMSNKTFKEISTTFYIFGRSNQHTGRHCICFTNPVQPPSQRLQIPGITITRKWVPKSKCFVILRRVGRNTTKQFYCVTGSLPKNCCFVENGTVNPGMLNNEC